MNTATGSLRKNLIADIRQAYRQRLVQGDFDFDAEKFVREYFNEHPEIVLVAFCGGNTRDIRENIDFRVYQQIMTPNGQKAATFDEPNVSLERVVRANNNGKGFMTPPLTDADY